MVLRFPSKILRNRTRSTKLKTTCCWWIIQSKQNNQVITWIKYLVLEDLNQKLNIDNQHERAKNVSGPPVVEDTISISSDIDAGNPSSVIDQADTMNEIPVSVFQVRSVSMRSTLKIFGIKHQIRCLARKLPPTQ